jgi:uncharacterized protein YdaU (DUF1376 family)
MSAPFMQLYVADYLGDTRHLTTEQHGAYLLLLMAMWRADGRLPNDPRKLARIAGCTGARWNKIGPDVLDLFQSDGQDLTHKRVTSELQKASEKSIKRAVSGARGGKAKALKTKRMTVANDTDLLWHSSDIRSQSSEDKSSGASSAVVDHDAEAWSKAVTLLTGQGGMTEKKARPFFGRLLRDHKLEPRDLLPSLVKATTTGTQDPQAYLSRAAEAIAGRRVQDAKPKRVGWV